MSVKKKTNCEICGKELVNGEFEEVLGICGNCIISDNKEGSFKPLFKAFLIIFGTLMSITVYLSIYLFVEHLFITFGANFVSMIPLLIVFLIVGSGLVYFLASYKYR